MQSVAESSFDAWIKFYRPDENTPNAVVSYYAKGSLVALALDLDAAPRRLVARRRDARAMAALRRPGIGVPEDAHPALASELAGRDLGDFFARYVDGTEDPPLAELLADVRRDARHARAATGDDDRGGKPGKSASRDHATCWLGARLARRRTASCSTSSRAARPSAPASPAATSLVALDGLRASAESIRQAPRSAAARRHGDRARVPPRRAR